MERKIVKQGRSAATVTLPSEWIKKKGLTFGDTVHILDYDESLLISSKQRKLKEKKIEVDICGYEKSMAYHVLFAKYIEGYDYIIIKHSNSSLVQKISKSFFGMVIEENNSSKVVLRNLIAEPLENIETLIQRVSRLFIEHARMLVQVIDGTVSEKDMRAHEQVIDDLVIYCMRFINKYEPGSETYKLFLLCSTLEYGTDQITAIAQLIGKDKKLAEKIIGAIENYVKNLLISDMKNMYKNIRSFRNSLKTKTFLDGLVYSLAESLYNNMGYLIKENK